VNNFLNTIQQGLHRVRKVWIITAVVVLGIVIGLAGFASGAFKKVNANNNLYNPVDGISQQAGTPDTLLPMSGMVATTDPMAALPGIVATPDPMLTMPGMAIATPAPAYGQYASGNEMDALLMQMQAMNQSLQGMMGQLDQRGGYGSLPAATPTALPVVDLQPIMIELQAINQEMGPLMVRIQADLQGTPSVEELASVRAQVERIQGRVMGLMTKLQAARAGTAHMDGTNSMPGMTSMPGMNWDQTASGAQTGPSHVSTDQYNALLSRMETMLQQLKSQQHAGSTTGQMGGMYAAPTPMPGMTAADPTMDQMMGMMDEMMGMMDNMMTMPSQSSANGMVMDNMMMMMDNMMQMMDGMMGMPDM
jgi:hypothetical protein